MKIVHVISAALLALLSFDVSGQSEIVLFLMHEYENKGSIIMGRDTLELNENEIVGFEGEYTWKNGKGTDLIANGKKEKHFEFLTNSKDTIATFYRDDSNIFKKQHNATLEFDGIKLSISLDETGWIFKEDEVPVAMLSHYMNRNGHLFVMKQLNQKALNIAPAIYSRLRSFMIRDRGEFIPSEDNSYPLILTSN